MKTKNKWPGIDEIRSSVNENDRIKGILPGLFHFSLPLIVWICTLVGIIFAPWWAKIILGLINGHAIGVMLIIGHDALHGILFPKRWMNRLARRLSSIKFGEVQNVISVGKMQLSHKSQLVWMWLVVFERNVV